MCLLGVERNVFIFYNNSFLRLRFLGEAFFVSDKQIYNLCDRLSNSVFSYMIVYSFFCGTKNIGSLN